MSERDTHPGATHFAFPYFFSTVDGINFQGITTIIGDLLIYYNGNDYIDCRCSRWNVSNKSIVIETWLDKSDLQNLRNNIVPGAVDGLYKIMGDEIFYDKTWQGLNTITLRPNEYTLRIGHDIWEGNNTSNLKNMRGEITVYPKTITTHPINQEWIGGPYTK